MTRHIALVVVAVTCIGCASPGPTKELKEATKAAAQQDDPLAGGEAAGTYPVAALGTGEKCWAGWQNIKGVTMMNVRTGLVVRRAWDAATKSVLEETVTFNGAGVDNKTTKPSRSLVRYTPNGKTYTATLVGSSLAGLTGGGTGTFEGTDADWTSWTLDLKMVLPTTTIMIKGTGGIAASYTQATDTFMKFGEQPPVQTGHQTLDLTLQSEADCKDKLSRVKAL